MPTQLWPQWRVGQRATAAMLNAQLWKSVRQATDHTINNSTTFQDTNLTVTVEPRSVYYYRLAVAYNLQSASPDGIDIVFQWTPPTNGSVRRFYWGYGVNGSPSGNDDFSSANFREVGDTSSIQIGATGSGTWNSYHESGLIFGGSTGGTASFRFAQRVANATDAVLSEDSRLDYIRIGTEV